ncbi:trimeric intracellular cation channel family protein [Novosphingopyxis sp. YJ-S2-01]|uniref:trimeric intracellular cation channel family protein n=1 Tax=Novosphingopyxis sp. YJ-S2-01 TaxID=2794021 RepID=UPI0018DE1F46|nr:trimeric intracellular cation channel family protein [Novosphingopyxis sp. YJ-S2-01]MBH9536344.1 trimeric intracellular cation channel family protein [Novosphingopyxis sp. YJ-S2-01]
MDAGGILPNFEIGPMLSALDLLGIAVFAASGALAAAQKGQTLVTFSFFALVTGVGGGTVRDLLIGAPVFWIVDNNVLYAIAVVVALIWITPQTWWRASTLDWFDAIGLAVYSVYGAAKAIEYGINPIPAALMGIITACVGGVIRDVLAGEPSIILRPEIYVTAAALASSLFVILKLLGMDTPIAAIVAALAGFMLRGAAIHFGWSLPAYRGNTPEV